MHNEGKYGGVFRPADILIPKKGTDLYKWSVIACDQYTSDPAYWQDVASIAGDAPSTLSLTFPEIYLEDGGVQKRIASITSAMHKYLDGGVFDIAEDSYILSVRRFPDGGTRLGLVGMLDLEHYDYAPDSKSLVRATEGTVLERIPPRLKIRENAPLECPHVMLLLDDPGGTVIEPVFESNKNLPPLFETELMKGGGHLSGYRVSGDMPRHISSALSALADPKNIESRYGIKDAPPLLFAVGDGNHSLATALECYRALKKTLGQPEAEQHPARYALCELVNIHDTSLKFEPIHRVLFSVGPEDVLARLKEETGALDGSGEPHATLEYIFPSRGGFLNFGNIGDELLVGRLQTFLDGYLAQSGGKIDYIHGAEHTRELAGRPSCIGFILPDISKAGFFKEIIQNGPYPRKTFSMGEAFEKRYYYECRRIK